MAKPLIDPQVKGIIAAFGYVDTDRLADVFIITDNGKTLEIAKGAATEPLLEKSSSIKWTLNNTDDRIVSVIPGDFGCSEHNKNAMMDILLVTSDINTFVKTNPEFKLWMLKGNGSHFESNNSVPFKDKVKSQPLVIDIDGDMIAEILIDSIDSNLTDCSQMVWNHKKPNFECALQYRHKSVNTKSLYPHSHAFIDLSNDKNMNMAADIFISGNNKMEYWIDEEGHGFSNHEPTDPQYISYPPNFNFHGQSTFTDINIDSIIDHIMPVCKGDLNTCDDPQILAYDAKSKEWISIGKDFKDLKDNTSSLLTFASSSCDYLEFPLTLRHGDIDGDGYVDLLTVMRLKNERRGRAVVLKNTPLSASDPRNSFGRKFVVYWMSDLSDARDVILTAFFDLSEDGKIDILINSKSMNNDKCFDSIELSAFINTQMIDACFFKLLVTSGVCDENCPPTMPQGTNQAGPFVCYELNDGDGNFRRCCGGQLSQSAHFALQMPYLVFGLGQTPNFIENASVSIPSVNKVRKREWTQIVPDAQVVVIPYPIDDPNNWVFKLFITPSNIVLSTLITLASICCVLVLIIGILHRRELLEDLAEHEEYKRHWPESR